MLKEHGTSFRQVLDAVRTSHHRHYVKEYGMSTIHLRQTTTSTPEQFLTALIELRCPRAAEKG